VGVCLCVRPSVDLYPPSLRGTIDELNDYFYEKLNNGVYRCGFATTQQAYDRAARDVDEALMRLESILAERRFIAGPVVSETDVRVLPTIARFDAAYGTLFRASNKRVRDLPNVSAWLCEMWALPGVPETFDLAAAHDSYYRSLFPLNPSAIIPTSPTLQEIGVTDESIRAAPIARARLGVLQGMSMEGSDVAPGDVFAYKKQPVLVEV